MQTECLDTGLFTMKPYIRTQIDTFSSKGNVLPILHIMVRIRSIGDMTQRPLKALTSVNEVKSCDKPQWNCLLGKNHKIGKNIPKFSII